VDLAGVSGDPNIVLSKDSGGGPRASKDSERNEMDGWD
jgi:hypothetical protein